MATVYTYYKAVVPMKFRSNEEVGRWLNLLGRCGVLEVDEEGGEYHFHVVEDDEGDGNPSVYFRLSDDARFLADWALQELLRMNRVSLVYEDSFCSGWGGGEGPEYDPVEAAEQIPTLILQEVLAKRLS